MIQFNMYSIWPLGMFKKKIYAKKKKRNQRKSEKIVTDEEKGSGAVFAPCKRPATPVRGKKVLMFQKCGPFAERLCGMFCEGPCSCSQHER